MAVHIHHRRISSLGRTLIALTLTANALPAFCQKPSSPGWEAQQTQQADQMEQERNQEMEQEALAHPGDPLLKLESDMQQQAIVAAKLRERMREDFRRHYQILRTNAGLMAQIAAELQMYAEDNRAASLPPDMLSKAVALQKLAHQLRVTVVGHNLAAMKKTYREPALGPGALADPSAVLLERANAILSLATTVRSAIQQYLTTDNEQSVSARALQRENIAQKKEREAHMDSNLALVMNASLQLEALCYQLQIHNPTASEVSASR